MGGRYVLSKVGQAIFTIVLLVILNFVLFRMMPGSPERVLGRNPNVTPGAIAATRERWGLDKPVIPDQLVAYLAATAQGDLGFSFVYRGLPVVDVLADRIWPTVILFGLGEIIAIVLGVGLGAYSGWRRGGLVDHLGNGASLVLYATPYFLIGMTLLLVFAVGLGWFPTYGMYDVGATYNGFTDQLTDFLSHLALPLATVALGLIGQYAIVMRSSTWTRSVRTTSRRPAPRASTMAGSCVPTRSPMRCSRWPPHAINPGYVVAGAITVEVVFAWPAGR